MIRRLFQSIDRFTLCLIATVALASLLPARGGAFAVLGQAVTVAVMLLFFLHGAKLPREAVMAGLTHWRLHLMVLAASFALFPLIGVVARPLILRMGFDPVLLNGLLFLCCLPSTVQSSIAFTSIARGNVAAAICSASASNLLGILLTPVLVGLVLSAHGGFSLSAIGSIAMQLLLPFLAGQVLRRWIGGWVGRHKTLLTLVDRGSILLMVYSAFGEAVQGGIWTRVSLPSLGVVVLLCAALLSLVLVITRFAAKRAGFAREDEITIVFCGSKKSLVTGVPMANILFPGAVAGTMVLPLMIFHQMQLMVCAVLARRYAARPDSSILARPLGEAASAAPAI